MSRSISLYWSNTINQSEIIQCVSDLGGVILDDERLDFWISAGDCHVWIYGVREDLAGLFEPAYDEGVDACLGAPPRMGITLTLSHEENAGALALRIASEFLRRWPGVACCAAYSVIDVDDIRGSAPAILGPDICLALSAEPQVQRAIDEFGGLVITPSDTDMLTSVAEELRALDGVDFDPTEERILGLLPSNRGHVWVLSEAMEAVLSSDDRNIQELCSRVIRRLGRAPASVIRVVVGHGDETGEPERVAMSFAQSVLSKQPGVVVGLFSLTVKADEVARMLEDGQGILIR